MPAALAAGLEPILCVGETEEARDGGQTEAVLERQLEADLAGGRADRPRRRRRRLRADLGDRHRPHGDPRAGRGGDRLHPRRAARARRRGRRGADPLRRLGQAGNAAELLGRARSTAPWSAAPASTPTRLRRDQSKRRADARPPLSRASRWSSSTAGDCAEPGPGNAISLADTPVFDRLWEGFPHTRLSAQGRDVGLPDGQMGNSEVGHLNLGAGAIVKQDLARIDDAIADGTLLRERGAARRLRARPPRPARPPAPARPGLRRRRPLRLGAHRGDDRARLAGGRPRRRLPRLHRRPRHASARRPRLPGRARALAAPGRSGRNGRRPLLRDGPRHSLGADQARLRRDRPRRAARARPPRTKRSPPPTSARRPTSSCARP